MLTLAVTFVRKVMYVKSIKVDLFCRQSQESENCKGSTYSYKTVLGLELLGRFQRVVDKGEASGLATTELSLVAEAENNILLSLVHLGNLLTKLILGDVSTAGMDNINDHLLALEQAVSEELSSPDRDRVGLIIER
jgi:uncharacterized protein YejL (UPF0352 family)